MPKPYLSVIIPCYNEKANLKRGVLQQVDDFLSQQKHSWEVLIIDDGSTDGSQKIVKRFVSNRPNFLLYEESHAGKPFAQRVGIQKARGGIILTTDMDQSTPIREVNKLLPWFEKGYQVVIGSRGLKREGNPWYRQYFTTPVFRFLRGLFVLPEIVDTQCGFKAYKAEVIKEIFARLEVFDEARIAKGWRVSAFDVEILFLAKKKGYKIKEVVVDWQDQDVSTTKSRDFFSESKNMAKEIVRVKLNDWQGKYDEVKNNE